MIRPLAGHPAMPGKWGLPSHFCRYLCGFEAAKEFQHVSTPFPKGSILPVQKVFFAAARLRKLRRVHVCYTYVTALVTWMMSDALLHPTKPRSKWIMGLLLVGNMRIPPFLGVHWFKRSKFPGLPNLGHFTQDQLTGDSMDGTWNSQVTREK